MAPPRITLGVDSLALAGSGIGRVARLMARVLEAQVREGQIAADVIALHSGADDFRLPIRAMGGGRLAFVAALHASAARSDALVFDFAGIARARPRLPPVRRPILTWMHGIETWEQARPDHLASLRAARVLLSNTRYTRARAVGLHPGLDHARVCWLGTEHDTAPERRPAEGPPTVIIIGRMDAREAYKGHRELIDAWPAVRTAVPNAELIVVGQGSDRQTLQARAAATDGADGIRFVGFVPEAELEALWRRAHVFAMPSRGEGFGLAYVEAMRRGVPVLASAHDAAVEVNVDGQTGYNVDLDCEGALARRLVALLSDAAHAADLGAAGQQRWTDHYRFSAFRDRFEPALNAVLGA